MFCPNCGTENEETATPCKKCGFKLRGVSAPKFKGTMLLNSDQAVQQLVQEARRRLEQGSAPDSGQAPLPQNGGPSATWGSQATGLRTLNGGLQPPRVSSPKVGRTMMGVAPQIGGYAPPSLGADSARAEPESNLGQPAPAVSLEASPVSSEIEPTSSQQTAKPQGIPAPLALGLDAVAANDDGPWPGPESAEAPLAAEGSPERVTTEVGIAAVAQNAAADVSTSPTGAASPAAAPEPPRRIHPLEMVLLVFTFGLYGFVLWARHRRHAAASRG